MRRVLLRRTLLVSTKQLLQLLKEYTGRVVNYDAKNKLEYLIDFGKKYKKARDRFRRFSTREVKRYLD